MPRITSREKINKNDNNLDKINEESQEVDCGGDSTSYKFLTKVNEIVDSKQIKKESSQEVKKVFKPEDLHIDDVDDIILKKTEQNIKKIKKVASSSMEISNYSFMKEPSPRKIIEPLSKQMSFVIDEQIIVEEKKIEEKKVTMVEKISRDLSKDQKDLKMVRW